jgi:hypothetical protein
VEINPAWVCLVGLATELAFSFTHHHKNPQPQLLLQENSTENKTKNPCCCDDPCESVESTPNRFSTFTCSRASPAPFCDNSGKSGRLALMDKFAHVSSTPFNRFLASFSILLHRI